MERRQRRWSVSVISLLVVLLAAPPLAFAKTKVGKNPGQVKGRWLEVEEVEALKAYDTVCIGDLETQFHWKNPEKQSPIDEGLLQDKIKQYLLENLRGAGLFGRVEDSCSEGAALRLDCTLEVEPGSRAARYLVGFGAGKSKSVFEIHLRDNESKDDHGLYHGYGTGSGMGFKLAGGGARKMTEDDVQENAKKFVELLQEVW